MQVKLELCVCVCLKSLLLCKSPIVSDAFTQPPQFSVFVTNFTEGQTFLLCFLARIL